MKWLRALLLLCLLAALVGPFVLLCAGCRAEARTEIDLLADLREAVRVELRAELDAKLGVIAGVGNRLDQIEQTIGNVGRDVKQNDPTFMVWGVVAQILSMLVICGGGMLMTNRTVREVVRETVCRYVPSCAKEGAT